MENGQYKLHRIRKGKDSVIGVFEINDAGIAFSSKSMERHCDMFPSGPLSQATKNRIKLLLNNDEKAMYLEKV